MTPLFLLKMLADLLAGDKVSKNKLECARTIVNNLIEWYSPDQKEPQLLYNPETKEVFPVPDKDGKVPDISQLDAEALIAKKELGLEFTER